MARISSRQGVVRHQESPFFLSLSGGMVSLAAVVDPTIVNMAHGPKDYLFTESESIPNAWGPFSVGTDYWLYWDINLATGIRTFGSTIYEPIEQAVAPESPSTGQMWFNTSNKFWFEWNGLSWVEVVRVFACKLENGNTFRSMSINAPDFRGTQVGLTTTVRSGSFVYDSTGKPIKTGTANFFFTTEDVFTTGVPTGASLRINNILIPGQAQEPMAAYTVVTFSTYNRIEPATPFLRGDRVFGIIEEDVTTNQVVNFTTEGLIFNEDWDWMVAGALVNDPVYIDNTGQIQLTQEIADQLPVGVIVDKQSILFSPKLFPQIDVVALPASTQECSVLVADDLNGWVEQPLFELPRSFEIDFFAKGQALSSGELCYRKRATHDFTLLDFGHQLYAASAPANQNLEYTFWKDALQIGQANFNQDGSWSFDFYNDSYEFTRGDRFEIRAPAGDTVGLNDVSVTLHGHTLPCNPCGTLSVSFNKPLYIVGTDDFTPFEGLQIEGSWNCVEWAVVALSADDITYWPMDDVLNHGVAGAKGVVFDGATLLDSESEFWSTTTVAPTLSESGVNALYYRVVATVHGPAGVERAVCRVKLN